MDVDQLNRSNRWPDWKNRGAAYESQRLLGWMWREMTSRMDTIAGAGVKATEECQAPRNIRNILTKCCNDDLIVQMKEEMQRSIREYIVQRERHPDKSIEDYHRWQSNYCSGEWKKLIDKRAAHSAADQSSLAAAV